MSSISTIALGNFEIANLCMWHVPMDANPTDLPEIKGQLVKINQAHPPPPLVELLSGQLLAPTSRDLHGWSRSTSLFLHDPTLVVEVCKAPSTPYPMLATIYYENMCLGRFWGAIGHNTRVSKQYHLIYVVILEISFTNLTHILYNPLKWWLIFLKPSTSTNYFSKRFNCSYIILIK